MFSSSSSSLLSSLSTAATATEYLEFKDNESVRILPNCCKHTLNVVSCENQSSQVVKPTADEVAISIPEVVPGEEQNSIPEMSTRTIVQTSEVRVSFSPSMTILKFDKALGHVNRFLLNSPTLILLVAIVSIVVSFICAVVLAVVLEPVRRSETWSWSIVALFAFFLISYLASLVHGIDTRWRRHIPGIRTYPYAFTIVRSILQIGVLLGCTYLDCYLKSRNGVFIVAAVGCFHVHLVCVFVAFRIGEDCDIINAFLSTSFILLYEFAKENAKSVICLIIAATKKL